MTDNIPKDVKVYEKVEQILELGMKEDGKVERILELVQQLVSNQNNLQNLSKDRFRTGNGERCEPFLEEYWEDDGAHFVPGGEAVEDAPNGDRTRNDTVHVL
ncbi:hypothetical protein L1987_44949 [Smallanthus sonchifolius]|uniref:Uncharacterized protein n=1 Tax=Smallanthus sonchifolius TaxID=185202 RepID=A0ACB9GRW5_9ASTR|nr:hypothetical protein L1987_44949 [Smallanthus sonchifolius]